MRKGKFIYYSLVVLLFLSSCEKKEGLIPFSTPPAGSSTITVAGMGEDYTNQVFFELSTGVTKSNDPSLWDISIFTGNDESPVLLLNDYNNSRICNLGQAKIETPVDVKNLVLWQLDNPNGSYDSSAVGKWCYFNSGKVISKENVYIIDRGDAKNINPKSRYFKFKITGADQSCFNLQYQLAENSGYMSENAYKDSSQNCAYFNFISGNVKNEAMHKTKWDLVFRKYRDKALNTQTLKWEDYLVAGALSSPNGVEVAVVENIKYEEITLSVAQNLKYTIKRNGIGYNWKSYDINAARYTVNPNKIYLVKDTKGYLYKLRFLDFYNDQFVKGFPKLEFQRL